MSISTGTAHETQQLRAALLALRAPQGEQRRPAPRSSVYGRVAAAVPGMARQVSDAGQPLTLPLRPDDALAEEWALVVCGPQRRLAFLARRRPTGEVWDWLVTQDAVAVQRAATALLERVPFLDLRVPTLAPA